MYKIIKRIFDFITALVLLILLSPVILVLIILLAIANEGHPFFTQLRPGKNEQIFKLIKFKSMNEKKDGNGELLPDAQRLTPVGRFIRKTSLDELPQLVNVFLGDMSLVGPRPLLIRYLPYYTQQEKIRHSVRPGITGWAQVNGRNFLDWDKRLQADIHYVEHISFRLDMLILFKTVQNVVSGKDVLIDQEATVLDLDVLRS